MTPTWVVWAFCALWITGIALAASYGGELWVTRAVGVGLLPASLITTLIAIGLLMGWLK